MLTAASAVGKVIVAQHRALELVWWSQHDASPRNTIRPRVHFGRVLGDSSGEVAVVVGMPNAQVLLALGSLAWQGRATRRPWLGVVISFLCVVSDPSMLA